MLPQVLALAQLLGVDPPDNLLAVGNKLVELCATADIELSEPLEEFHQVAHRRVPEDLGLPVVFAGEPLGEVGDDSCQLAGERLFRHLDRLVEPRLHPPAFLFVERRVDARDRLHPAGDWNRGESCLSPRTKLTVV